MPERGRHCCRPAALCVSAGTFTAVDAVPSGGHDDVLLMPPLANAHDHMRGVRPISLGSFDLPLELWLTAMTNTPKVDPCLVATAGLGRQALGGVGEHCSLLRQVGWHFRLGRPQLDRE